MKRAYLGGLPVRTQDEVADQIADLLANPSQASTTASTYHGPAITVDSVRLAMEKLDRLPPAPTEIRLHPDDLCELRLQAGENVFQRGGILFATSNRLLGLPVVEDEKAERLPRKKGA